VGFSPVDGDETITQAIASRPRDIVHAENISRELKALLRAASLTVEHGQVVWIIRYRGDTPVLVTDPTCADDFPSDEF
jgi:hypothetical protein